MAVSIIFPGARHLWVSAFHVYCPSLRITYIGSLLTIDHANTFGFGASNDALHRIMSIFE